MVSLCLGRSVAPDEADGQRRFNGLKNQGNTCHLNVILQALYMTPEVREGVLEASFGLDPKELPPLPRSLAALFNRLSTGRRACSTAPVTKTLRGHGMNRQQDTHDTYLLLCDRLETDLKGTAQKLLTQNLFQGKQRDYVKCHTCKHTSFTEDLFSNLSIDLPSESGGKSAGAPAGADVAAGRAARDGEVPTSVVAALRAALEPEQLVGEDQYECDKCGCKRDAERGVRLRRLPPILVLHLKRFASSVESDKRGRVRLKLTKLNLPLPVSAVGILPFATRPPVPSSAVYPKPAALEPSVCEPCAVAEVALCLTGGSPLRCSLSGGSTCASLW